jgi:DNA repair protein RecN (Recombination protein N)
LLSQLYIQNVAVIQKAAIDFDSGLNVFSGETGAGKTILISAIDAVLGERASKDMIRTGEEKAFVSALFEDISPRAAEKLSELGYADDEGALLVSREINQSGKSVCKINGQPATASVLKELSPLLIHTHGQRDSAALLHSESHLEIIDAYAGLGDMLSDYKAAYGEMRGLEEELEGCNMDEAQKAQRVDMLTFQINEIEAASLLDPGEEDELAARKRLIKNSGKIIEGLSQAYAALSGDESSESITGLLDSFTEGLSAASGYVADFEAMLSRATGIGYELEEFSGELRAFLDDFEYDPHELDRIESRLDIIYRLKRKYGADIAEIIAFGERAAEELEGIAMSGERAKKLAARLKEATQRAAELAAGLTGARAEAAARFVSEVERELKFLDMPNVKLSVLRTQRPLSGTGADFCELMIITNVGEAPKPLSKIASGGETARLMLAIKNVYAGRDDVGTLIFDEIDSGVSGRAAQKIGRKLRQVSRLRQVICVTHLAQVASFADRHLLIRKEVAEGRTFTRVKPLTKTEAIEELARITGGDLITRAALKSAAELWEHSHGDEAKSHGTKLTADAEENTAEAGQLTL